MRRKVNTIIVKMLSKIFHTFWKPFFSDIEKSVDICLFINYKRIFSEIINMIIDYGEW